MQERYLIKNLEELETFAEELLFNITTRKEVSPPSREGGETSFLVALVGNLGAGKTALVQKVAKILDIKEAITSPTFILMKSYKINFNNFINLVHIDAYRLSKEEGKILKIENLLEEKGNLIFLEWSNNLDLEKIKGNKNMIFLEIKNFANNNDKREILIKHA